MKKLVHARCEDNSGSRTPRGNNAGGGENQIASQAERLTQEAVAAEEEISRRPELLKQLGLPTALCRVLAEEAPMTPAAGCVIRFDFHHTTQGWRISEANSDVPGGFSEASYFTGMMAEHFPGLRPAGNPADVWSTALAAAARQSGVVALLSAPGHMEDHHISESKRFPLQSLLSRWPISSGGGLQKCLGTAPKKLVRFLGPGGTAARTSV